jgi:hypothetical protein
MHKYDEIHTICLRGYPGHSSKRRVRPASLPTAFVNVYPDLEQSRTVGLHKTQFILVLGVRFAENQLRMPLGRDFARQIEQPDEFARRDLDRRLAHDRSQFGGDAPEYVGRREHAEMRDVLRAIRMVRV